MLDPPGKLNGHGTPAREITWYYVGCTTLKIVFTALEKSSKYFF
jgi:hypothetical protein